VHVTATGLPLAFAAPSAKKPAQRSSICDQQLIRGSRTSDRMIGELREPGAVQACCIPQRANSSHSARRSRGVAFVEFIGGTEEMPSPPSRAEQAADRLRTGRGRQRA